MAHFAQVDANSMVLRVVVISNDDVLDPNGNESEQIGIDVCKSIFGQDTNWVQTSYGGSFRKKFASVGDKYLSSADIFFNPIPPFQSWVLNDDFDWVSPVEMPDPLEEYEWDDDSAAWVKSDVQTNDRML